MGIIAQRADGRGSLCNFQILVNEHQSLINNKIKSSIPMDEKIEWLSPLADQYYEYRDEDFLKQLNLDHLYDELRCFWPKNGPQWDGLAKTDSRVFLFEAKANLPEMISPPCGARSKQSRELIHHALERTKQFITPTPILKDWSQQYYQYTNRLAHLYFLREHGVQAYLIFIYFIGDSSVNGPTKEEQWKEAKKKLEQALELPEVHSLSDYI